MLKKLIHQLPYLYFAMMGFSIAGNGLWTGNPASWGILFFSGLFVYQFFKERKSLNILLGILMMVWSVLMLLAFLSDAVKITQPLSSRAVQFLTGGGLIVALNFVMAARLLLRASQNASKAEIKTVSQ